MEALLPVFLAALLATFGDKAQTLAALLSDRYRRDRAVLSGILLAVFANAILAVGGGSLIREAIPFRAVGLLAALALVFAGIGALLPGKPPKLDRYRRLGPFGASLCAFFTHQFGDATQFLTLALAARTGSVTLSAIGATAGVMVACAPAVLLGTALPRRVPVRAIRTVCGIALLLAGLWAGVGALGLV